MLPMPQDCTVKKKCQSGKVLYTILTTKGRQNVLEATYRINRNLYKKLTFKLFYLLKVSFCFRFCFLLLLFTWLIGWLGGWFVGYWQKAAL